MLLDVLWDVAANPMGLQGSANLKLRPVYSYVAQSIIFLLLTTDRTTKGDGNRVRPGRERV